MKPPTADTIMISATRAHAERAAQMIESVLPLDGSAQIAEMLTAALEDLLDAAAYVANVDDAWRPAS